MKADSGFEAAQALTNAQVDGGVVLVRDLLDDGQPEAAAGQLVSQAAIEAIEHAIPLIGRDSRAAVLDDQVNLIEVAHHFDIHATRGRRVTDSVVDQIAYEEAKLVFTTGNRRLRRALDPEIDAPRGGKRHHFHGDLPGQPIQ